MQLTKRQLLTTTLVLLMIVVVFGIWALAAYFGFLPETKKYTSQPFADAFSGFTALFTGLAFVAAFTTLGLQIHQLFATRDDLKKTAEANAKMVDASVALARSADERAVLDMFQTYCSDYFQTVKDSSMSVLIPCVASRDYCQFVATRFFVAAQVLELPAHIWDKVSGASYCKSFEEFRQQEQRYRYKLDELINFFTMLVGRSNAGDIVARCDVSYSWWRPLLWLIAKAQQDHYDGNPKVREYATPMTLKDTLGKLDRIYGFKPFRTDEDFWEFFLHHPKVLSYGLDEAYTQRGSLATLSAPSQDELAPA